MTDDSNNNKSSIWIQLLNKLDPATAVMVLVMGGSNLFATKDDGRLTRQEAEQVAREIHDLHSELQGVLSRQREMVEKVSDNQQKAQQQLQNQTMMLENQSKILNTMHRQDQNFKNPEF